jgi:hypothetical protein
MALEFMFEYDRRILQNDKGIYFCNFIISYKDLKINVENQVFSMPSQQRHLDEFLKSNPLKKLGFKEIQSQNQKIKVKIEVLKYISDVTTQVYKKWKTS